MNISVILPIHNGMPFLPLAISSLLNQSYKDFIIYAIDNGSTDDTREFLMNQHNERLQYIRMDEKNLVKALNKGFVLSKTPFIARMDSDDLCHPDRFQKQTDFLNKNPEIGLVGSFGKYIGIRRNRQLNINLPVNHDEIIKRMLKSRNAIIHPSIIFRREIFDEFGGYDESYSDCEDYEYFLRVGIKIKFANLSERLHLMRVRDRSVMTEDVKKRLKQYYFVSFKYSYQYSNNKTKDQSREFHFGILKKIDILSLSQYRKGLNYYLNKNIVAGIVYFLIASLINPVRFFNAIKRRIFPAN